MKNTTLLSLAAIVASTAVIPSAAAYNGIVSNVRSGMHPYEQRKIDENRRKNLQDEYKDVGYFNSWNEAYFHPIYARRSALHPFYRKGGTTHYIEGRFACWRGYQDPVTVKALSPDSYCQNYYYQRLSYRSMPQGYQCF
jgi:hypothetical protein